MFLPVALIVVIVFTVVWIWNPGWVWLWRTNDELWKTREKSFGWPFYNKHDQFPLDFTGTTPVCKTERTIDNIIMIE